MHWFTEIISALPLPSIQDSLSGTGYFLLCGSGVMALGFRDISLWYPGFFFIVVID